MHCRYELYAVVAHGGQLTSSGHYIAYIRADPSSDVTASETLGLYLMLTCSELVFVVVCSIVIHVCLLRFVSISFVCVILLGLILTAIPWTEA